MTKLQVNRRIPTGALQTENDWPGLFVRGDDCMLLQMALISVLGGDLKHPSVGYLRDLNQIITKEVLVDGSKEIPG